MKKTFIILLLFITSLSFAQEGWDIRVVEDEITHLPFAKLTYIDGVLRIRCFYIYDEKGVLYQEIVDNGSTEDVNDLTDVTERTVTTYHPDGTSSTEIFGPAKESNDYWLSSYIQDIFQTAKDYMYTLIQTGLERQEAFVVMLQEEGERLMENVISPLTIRMIGNETRPALVGVHGHHELNEKVRVSFTNGIMNAPCDHEENLNRLSQTHGHTNIHYVFRQFDGWNHDIVRCTASKLGIISNQSKLIAKKWKELIEEMGGINGGGRIVHYAHSIGGTETYNAKYLMTKEELKMIHLITIGSPSLIPNRDFASVVNYVSKRDGVAHIDVINYFFTDTSNPDCNIFYVGTVYGWPFVDHPLTTDSYREVVQMLGERFVEKYGSKKE